MRGRAILSALLCVILVITNCASAFAAGVGAFEQETDPVGVVPEMLYQLPPHLRAIVERYPDLFQLIMTTSPDELREMAMTGDVPDGITPQLLLELADDPMVRSMREAAQGSREAEAFGATSLADLGTLSASKGATLLASVMDGTALEGSLTGEISPVFLTDAARVAGGATHCLALATDGTVWAWGDNYWGQLGDGTNTTRAIPTPVIGMTTRTVAIAAGDNHSLALDADGALWAWGRNYDGELGIGTRGVYEDIPVQVTGLAGAVAVAAGGYHSLAVRADGTIWAWGNNYYGQLGDGTTTRSATPLQVDGLTGAVAVAAGKYHSLAVKADGTVWAWGYNYYGQLGDGTTTERTTPVQVSGLIGVVAVAAGYSHSLALEADGSVWAWGRAYEGQLGDGMTTTMATVPVQVLELAGVTAIAAGGFHSLAVKENGTACAWGDNSSGQLGDGTVVDRATPTQIRSIMQAASAAAGRNYSLVVKADGTVWTWGDDSTGQLGDGTEVLRTKPAVVGEVAGVGTVEGGADFTLALKEDGTVWAWGDNYWGQLGDGTRDSRSIPVQVSGLTRVVSIAAGDHHSLAALADGAVWTWGGGIFLGDSAWRNTSVPVTVGGLTGVVAVAAGYMHSMALKADGTVWAWGENDYGQLGDGTMTDRIAPVPVAGLIGVTAIAAGEYHSLALKADGTVWAWGWNYGGQLGDGTEIDSPTPLRVSGVSDAVAVAAGYYLSLALEADGTVWIWGSNVGAADDAPATMDGVTGAVGIAAADSDALILKADGTALACGQNWYGEVGDGTTDYRFGLVPVDGLAGAVALAAGDYHSFAVLEDGTCLAWGRNFEGQLGDGRLFRSSSPMGLYGTPPDLLAIPSVGEIAISHGIIGGTIRYEIEIDGSLIDTGMSTNYVLTDPAINVAHVCRARSVNESGPGDWSELQTVYTLANPPSDGVLGDVTQYSIAASWQANGNPKDTEYSLAAFGSDGALMRQNAWTTGLSGAITSLSANTQYQVRVKARNGSGVETDWLQVGSVTTLAVAPAPPQGLSAVCSDSQVMLSWSASEGASLYYVYDSGNEVGQTAELAFPHTGLQPESAHTYTVKAWNTGGFSAPSAELTVTTLPPAPPPPVSIAGLEPTADAIAISWMSVDDDARYSIDCDGQITDVGAATSFVHTDLPPGTPHTYRVRASNPEGDGEWGEPVSSYTLLGTPVNVTASATDTSITVWWSAVDGASEYEVRVGDVTYSATGNSCVRDGLTPGAAYAYSVKAKNSVTESDWSPERTKFTLTDPPATPQGLAAVQDMTTVTLDWESVCGATSYDLEADGLVTSVGDATTFQDTGLDPGTEHTYRVRARNSGGKSAWSDPVSASTYPLPSDAPKNLRATATTDSITVEWDPIEGASGYVLEIDGSADLAFSDVAAFVHDGLEPESVHTYRVMSVCGEGYSAWSLLLTVQTRINSYPIPGNLSASADSSCITLTWDAAVGALAYDVEADGEVISDIAGTSYAHSGLLPETTHTYRVRTVNDGGVRGDWSEALIAATSPGSPQPPSGIVAIPGPDSVALSWTAQPDADGYRIIVDGGDPVTVTDTVFIHSGLAAETQHTYSLQTLVDDDGSEWTSPLTVTTLSDRPPVPTNLTATPASDSVRLVWTIVTGATGYEVRVDGGEPVSVSGNVFLDAGLTPETDRGYEVRAVYLDTPGDWCAPVSVTTLPVPPVTPENVTTLAASDSVTVTWDAVTGATDYEVMADNVVVYQGAGTSFTLTGLVPATQHSVSVRARNAGGASPWSSVKTVLTSSGLAGVPENLSCSSTTNAAILTWNPVTGASGYDLEADGVLVTLPDMTAYTDQGLLSGTEHTYRVRARNDAGPGEWSPLLTVATRLTAPVVTAEGSVESIALTWTAVEKALSYDIEADGELVAEGVAATTFTQTGLAFNSEHTYRVKARNAITDSDWSTAVVAATACPSTVFDCSAGEIIDFAIIGGDIRDVTWRTFTVAYDASELEVLDLCSTTPEPDLSIGRIAGTDITITRFDTGTQGVIVFTVGTPTPSGQTLDGALNTIRFRAKVDGETAVMFSIQ